jgi:hypothetical protein
MLLQRTQFIESHAKSLNQCYFFSFNRTLMRLRGAALGAEFRGKGMHEFWRCPTRPI